MSALTIRVLRSCFSEKGSVRIGTLMEQELINKMNAASLYSNVQLILKYTQLYAGKSGNLETEMTGIISREVL